MSGLNVFAALSFIAEKRIEEAQLKGEFDNLPGSGLPLELEDMSHVPEDLRMAYKILRNADCLPPELAERKEISRLTDLLEHCEDEQEHLRLTQKLRFMVTRAQMRRQRPVILEDDDPYYARILQRLSEGEARRRTG